MDGMKRVIVFCILIVILPVTLIVLPLYLRKTVFADVTYEVAESDIIEIRDGMSSLFCQKHSLRMSSSFNAFQLHSKPETSTTNRKHIRLKKSMTLPDDTLEYWGFYLLKGAKVHLRFCSRYDGSRILVVKGQRELQTCGLLDHNKNKVGANFGQGHEQVQVFFEDIAEIAVNIPPDDMDHGRNHTHEDTMERENHGGEENDGNTRDEKRNDGTISMAAVVRSNKNIKLHNNIDYISQKGNAFKREHADALRSSAKIERHFAGKQAREKVDESLMHKRRAKREHVYDRKYSHGGNALNFTTSDESNSISSFENGLFECYNGAILLAEGFPPSSECLNAHFLENGSHRMTSQHNITEDGYYYYIFYSDNDLVRNDIHAIFDIYKPTFQYSSLNHLQSCVNVTNCTFSVDFLSDDFVVVEVPTRDGIEHEEDDISLLISTCHPRTIIYAIFPITVLILILSCSFL